MIEAADVSVGYDRTIVLTGVGILARTGQVLGLIGPNGSGKTTLLKVLYRSLRPHDGTITVDERALEEYASKEVARRIAVVGQEISVELPLSVTNMVLLGRSPHRSSFQNYRPEDDQIAAGALTRVGCRHLADRPFATLSGGERQRVLIARCLAQQADHILLDEPTNHLDVRYQHEILQLVRSLQVTVIVVLHDLNLAARYCDRLVLLNDGRVQTVGTPHEVLSKELLESIYEVPVRRLDDNGCVQLIFGSTPYPSDGNQIVGCLQQ